MDYPMKMDFDRGELQRLLAKFRANVRRTKDISVARKIEEELLKSDPPNPDPSTYRQLAKWCRTEGYPYQDAAPIAREISRLLFGCILDREKLGV